MALPAGPLAVDIDHVTSATESRGDEDEPPVLIDVTAHIPAGQQVAVVGETGSGKTTLGRLIARLADPTAGTVRRRRRAADARRQRRPARRGSSSCRRSRSCSTAASPRNLSFARPELSLADARASRRSTLDLGDWLETLPDGIDTEVGQRGAQLSAGERQLVALVRASLVDPDVLVLDEATSSVDALTEVRLTRALDRLAAGRTTIAIAHRLSTAARADRVLVLEHGRLVQDGPHAELVQRRGAYARMYEAWVAATSAG